MLEKRLAIYPDVMDIKRIVSIIGYTDRTIRWHIGKGRIFAIIQDRKYLVSKYSLIIKQNESARNACERVSADCSAVARRMRA